MVCDLCKQQQATVHLTEIVDDQMTELHLCESCANQKGAQMESHFGLADLLAGLADFGKQFEPEAAETSRCRQCGISYEDFRKNGRLGCSYCYTTFRNSMASLLKRIHGSTQHVGKRPGPLGRQAKAARKLAELRRQLKAAIDTEAFEQAAEVRDAIRRLEEGQAAEPPAPRGRRKAKPSDAS